MIYEACRVKVPIILVLTFMCQYEKNNLAFSRINMNKHKIKVKVTAKMTRIPYHGCTKIKLWEFLKKKCPPKATLASFCRFLLH